MEIKLNDKDMAALAEKVTDNILRKLEESAAISGTFKAMEDLGKDAAKRYLNTNEIYFSAKTAFEEELKGQSAFKLEKMLQKVVKTAFEDLGGVKSAAYKQIVLEAKQASIDFVNDLNEASNY